nr:MAG TPA: hypothetical protein [Caudoviricetes sp.]
MERVGLKQTWEGIKNIGRYYGVISLKLAQ